MKRTLGKNFVKRLEEYEDNVSSIGLLEYEWIELIKLIKGMNVEHPSSQVLELIEFLRR